MAKSGLYAANVATQVLAVGDAISFGVPVRRFGCNTGMEGTNARIHGAGYYDIDTNITFEAGAVGTAVITLYKDGAIIPGANVSFTAAAATVYDVNIPAMIKQACDCESVITAVLTGVAGNVTNATIKVIKL